ncbi:hypothetical protein SARC_10500 [Sphaeroforma arctica JP610]|uniref:Glycerol-3-phosphate dehydrogenase n=1 Tax=Sphaeroforma arctica JP610 TaxID=667725 RepID=A0A0L0FLY1_9EUKA|nr:hypothetical protein SARC_10500 [Sphaeroforma arctica JP610]KNC77028.1 hypothetical protein SARC_10500 [Sphaeroforma arctica JP610]|eukprot:XP_014150930.1 hypothetical protein SARC_10500 [Sphaeroforma arctica JP610]
MPALRKIAKYGMYGTGAVAVGASVALGMGLLKKESSDDVTEEFVTSKTVTSREQSIKQLKERKFDVLVVGGGATGSGCALDATTRGLSTALVERADFASGTSSRSTKLIHGGVRYLEKAVFQLDLGQLQLVFEALHERKAMIDHAPHLAHPLAIITPCYKWWEVPYFWAGMKAYDFVAGTQGLFWSSLMTARSASRVFPTLSDVRDGGDRLCGAIVYYDGQMDDARMNLAIATTAVRAGATVANYTEVLKLEKDANGKITGAIAKDLETGEEFRIQAKSIINAAGPFVDALRSMDTPDVPKIVAPSSGVHVTLPDFYSPQDMGLIVPKTEDGRVVFMLPWQGHTIAGTTDTACDLTMEPKGSEEEVAFILKAIKDYLTVDVRKEDLLSVWSGIRPLASDPSAGNTENISRDHVVFADASGLVTITGGKWTTYRLMAEDAVNKAIEQCNLVTPRECQTANIKLTGAVGYKPTTFTEIAQSYTVPHRPGHIDTQVAKHLATAYGTKSFEVTKIAEDRKLGQRLVRGHPYIEAEVVFSVKDEMCRTISDFIARRTRLAFLDTRATSMTIDRVGELMAAELGWDDAKLKQEISNARSFLKSFQLE